MRTVAIAALLLLACHKPRPSPEYTEASGSYTTLLAEMGDDAFADERMARIEALLQKVPQDSLDAQGARELQGRINAERNRVQAEAVAQQKALEKLNHPPPTPDSPSALGTSAVEAKPEVPDAGGAAADLKRGMTVEEMRTQSGDCFNSQGALKVRGPGGTEDGEMFVLRDIATCTNKYPQYRDRTLVFTGGRLLGPYDKADMMTPQPKGEPAKAPTAAPQPGTGGQGESPTVTFPGQPKPGTPLPSPGENTAAPPPNENQTTPNQPY
jgi:hypothetical protein